MQEIDFKEIKTWLEHGDIAQLAEANKISRVMAYNVLAGRSRNFAFLEKAMNKAMENKSRILNGIQIMKKLSA